MTEPMNACGLCAAHARTEIDFRLGVPQIKRSRHEGAEEVALQMPLCESCGEKAYKHLTRFFGRTHFRPIEE